MAKLLLPEAASAQLARHYQRGHAAWLRATQPPDTTSRWPWRLPLGSPTEAEATARPTGVRAWVQAWQAWPGPGVVQWHTVQWPRLGSQHLPQALVLPGPEALADIAGQGRRWRRASTRLGSLAVAWPPLAGANVSQRVFDSLADDTDDDIQRLAALLHWVATQPASGLTLRQLPVPGLHTKWLEQRKALVLDLLALRPGADAAAGRDLHAHLGLTRPPVRLRLRLLCPQLRQGVGGLTDLEAPLAELAALRWQPQRVLVVENLDSGLALPDLAGTVAVLKLGHAVSQLRQLPWLAGAQLVYWGDIDTHGLVMLDKARQAWPQVQSMLMDPATLRAHHSLCVEEPQPWAGPTPTLLQGDELALFNGLVQGTWGHQLRLEQERLPWNLVLRALAAAWR